MVAPQRSQALRAARPRVHADARRLRPLALEVFFFGTAIVCSSEAVGRAEMGALTVEPGPGDPTRLAGPTRNRRRRNTWPTDRKALPVDRIVLPEHVEGRPAGIPGGLVG